MKSLIILVSTVTVLCLGVYGDTYTVDSTSSTAVITSPLQMGTTYLFEAQGTYQYDRINRPDGWADAEWMYYYGIDPNTGERINDLGIVEKRGLGVTEDILDLVINGQEVDWLGNNGAGWAAHTFSPDHVYRYYVTGDGSPASLVVADWEPLVNQYNFGDNAGSLTVTVSPVPESTSSLSLLGGVVAMLFGLKRSVRK
jgi:hypothetical protein